MDINRNINSIKSEGRPPNFTPGGSSGNSNQTYPSGWYRRNFIAGTRDNIDRASAALWQLVRDGSKTFIPVKIPGYRKWTILILFLTLTLSCKKEEMLPELPALITAKVTEINQNGAAFGAELLSLPAEPVTEHGFVWDTIQNPTISSSRIIFGTLNDERSFSVDKTGDHKAGLVYYVKAFIRTGGRVIYGNWSKFESRGCANPEIDDFKPATGSAKSEFTIYGKYFSYLKNHITVKVGPYQAIILEADDQKIRVRLPWDIKTSGKVKISVTIAGNTTISKKDFLLSGPVIHDIEPASGTCKSTITITGEKFIMSGNNLSIPYFKSTDEQHPDLIWANTLEITEDRMVVEVPVLPSLGTYYIVLRNGIITTISPYPYTAIGAEISSVSPLNATVGSVLTIKGNYLYDDITETRVFLGDQPLNISDISLNEIKAVVPYDIRAGNYQVLISNKCSETWSDQYVTVASPWEKIKDMPVPGLKYPVTFAIGDKFYVALGYNDCFTGEKILSKEVWEYDPATNFWTRKADFPGEGRFMAITGVVNEKAIVGMGLKSEFLPVLYDFWMYDPVSDQWEQIQSLYPGGEAPVYFTADNRFFCSFDPPTQFDNDVEFFEYDAGTDSWNMVGYLPKVNHTGPPACFETNGKGYMISWNENFEFDPASLAWTRMNELEQTIFLAYDSPEETVVLNFDYEPFLLDPLSGTLTPLPSYLMDGERYNFTGIVHDHHLYIGLGDDGSNCLFDFIRLNLNDLP